MPLDIEIDYIDGTKEMIYIPIRIMRGEKPNEYDMKRTVLADWPWTNPTYSFDLDVDITKIKKITIDPKREMADTQRKNNEFVNVRKRVGIEAKSVQRNYTK